MIATGQSFEQTIADFVDRRQSRLIELARGLIRIPSENTPPSGAERACQEYIAEVLRASGWQPELYDITEVKGLAQHPLFQPGRDYGNRPNLGARRKGTGGGRSLVLSGHIDTVPRGTQPWTRDAFGGEVDGNRVYGRGSNDMKAGVAMNLFIAESLSELGLHLAGDLIFETVIDEEFGGVNGTLAGRLRGFNGDAAVIAEPSFLRICPAQRGGRTAHITFRAPGGVLTEGGFPGQVVQQLTHFLSQVPAFAAARRQKAHVHELYARHEDPVPVSITKIFTSPWGTREPITIPEECKVEFFWQLMPGEAQEDVEREFQEWLDGVVQSAPSLFSEGPEVTFPIRWMPGSAILKSEPLVRELAACAQEVLGAEPPIVGIEGPCDMFVFHQAFSIPAVLWGPRGGNTHAADEYVEIDSLVAAAKTLMLFVCRWCGPTSLD
ncbi:MAG TPA: M20/M25/M40 family metallo-hydrolase [Bryobacteraceae bacterium]|nr:M20/M25/M40 family metallo-hydrolase [Bryobacteraceae bacterium]